MTCESLEHERQASVVSTLDLNVPRLASSATPRPKGSRRRRRRQDTLAALLSLCMLASPACSIVDQESEVLTVPRNRCESDEACGSAARCELQLGICVVREAPDFSLEFDVIEGGSAAFRTPATYRFPTRNFERSDGVIESTDFTLPETTTVAGLVRSSLVTTGAVPATLSFRAVSTETPITTLDADVTTSDNSSRRPDGEIADFAVRLLANTVYDVTVTPAGEALRSLPPKRFANIIVLGGGDFQRVDLVYEDAFTQIEGGVFSTDENGERTPEAGVQVRAVSSDRARVLSSTALTSPGESGGTFTLRGPPDLDDYLIRVGPSALRPDFPTLFFAPAAQSRDENGRIELKVPAFSFVALQGQVTLPSSEQGSIPSLVAEGIGAEGLAPATPAEERVTIRLRSLELEGFAPELQGSFDTVVSASTDGRFVTELVRGIYEIAIVPPQTRNAGILVETIDLSDTEGGLIQRGFRPPMRTELATLVRTPDGRPGAGLTYGLTALSVASSGAAARSVEAFARPLTSSTTSEGRLRDLVDRGQYNLVLQPPGQSAYPWTLFRDIRVDTAVTRLEDLVLAFPVAIQGRITAAAGQNAGNSEAGAEVRAYAPATRPGGERILIGRATADTSGAYEIMIDPNSFH